MAINKNPLNLPTEKIDLTTKGLIYPLDHLLSKGFVEIVYPGAKQEDILTNTNYINNGIAVDKYLESILLTEVALDDMTPADKDGLMISARILGFGKNYTTAVHVPGNKTPEPVTFDITTFKQKEVDWSLFKAGENEFSYTLERDSIPLKFRLLTGNDYKAMGEEETGMKKVQSDYSADTSLFLKYSLVEVNGKRDTKSIRDFVDRMLQPDTRELKKYIASVSPGYLWRANGVRRNKEVVEDLFVPYTADFFWPGL